MMPHRFPGWRVKCAVWMEIDRNRRSDEIFLVRSGMQSDIPFQDLAQGKHCVSSCNDPGTLSDWKQRNTWKLFALAFMDVFAFMFSSLLFIILPSPYRKKSTSEVAFLARIPI